MRKPLHMKTVGGRLEPEDGTEARELVRRLRQEAVDRLDRSDNARSPELERALVNSAKELLDEADRIADEWGVGTRE